MLQTLKVKVNANKEQHEKLLCTIHRFNDACNDIATTAYEKKCANKVKLQKIVYYDIRERYGLSAQMTVRAISKVVEAYKRNKKIKPIFKQDGAMVYDQRILSWKGIDRVSILTLDGRLKLPIVFGQYQAMRLNRIRGQADLIYRDKTFYLAVVVDVPEEEMIKPVGVLGVDMGIVNIAVDSDGDTYSGKEMDNVREKTEVLKADLQKCGTKSAKRHLRKTSGREARFRRNMNHCISKELIAKAKDTQSIIALEELSGIKTGTTVKKSQRSRHHSWGFYQLRQFIEYKATIAGIPVVGINPAYTSQECPICHHISKNNRPDRDTFKCELCDFFGHADHIAAINISARVDQSTYLSFRGT